MSEADGNLFFEHPILNSPYKYPVKHWELDEFGQPTQKIIDRRRFADFFTPIPKPKKQNGGQGSLLFDEKLDSQDQQYNQNSIINEVRKAVDTWRLLPKQNWNVTP